MKDIAIVVARYEVGLYEVVRNTGYVILEETKQHFTSLVTHNDVHSKRFGSIRTAGDEEGGWIAFAVYLN